MKHLLTQWQMAVKWSIALFASLCCLLFWGCKQATHFQMQLEHMNELESIIYVEGQAKILRVNIRNGIKTVYLHAINFKRIALCHLLLIRL